MHMTLPHCRVMPLAILLTLFLAACAPVQGQATLFADDFDAGGSAANWTLYTHAGDYTADFACNYAALGVPSAPNSMGGSTIGLKFTVNNNDTNPAADAVSAYPTGLTLSGDFTIKFDLWLNYNGGSGGGTGSTEFATFGFNHAGDRVVWPNNPASDGFWFAVSGEGGAADDYRVQRLSSLLTIEQGVYAALSRNHTDPLYQTLFPSPPFETPGAPGKRWVEVEISQHAGVIEWRLDGMLLSIRYDTLVTAGDLMLGYMDIYASIADPAADNYVLFDNVRVEAPDCNSNSVADAQDLLAGTSHDCNGDGRLDDCTSPAAADFDLDGDTDIDDLEALALATGGPDMPPNPPTLPCLAAWLAALDLDVDADLDLLDFATLQRLGTAGLIPPRPMGARLGTRFIADVAGLTLTQRETAILLELTAGNVPGFLRTFVPITVSATIGGNPVQATYYITPDYMCLGRDDDFVRVPMTPLIAQPLADAFGCLLPTRKMVNDIYVQAAVKLAPWPISPTTCDIMRTTTQYRHHQHVELQRAGYPLGPLVGGIKKDVVITPQLASNPNRVAIYGWHRLDGTPIQPLYLGHGISYVDYSHGIRLVRQEMLVNGVPMSVADVLNHPDLHVLLSDEGPVPNPRY